MRDKFLLFLASMYWIIPSAKLSFRKTEILGKTYPEHLMPSRVQSGQYLDTFKSLIYTSNANTRTCVMWKRAVGSIRNGKNLMLVFMLALGPFSWSLILVCAASVCRGFTRNDTSTDNVRWVDEVLRRYPDVYAIRRCKQSYHSCYQQKDIYTLAVRVQKAF